MKNHNIILLADTNQIIADHNNGKTIDFDDYCRFADQTKDGTLELYTVKVRKSDKVTWLGLSDSSETDEVSITEIAYEAGTDIMGSIIDTVAVSGRSKRKRGTVKKGKRNQWEKYKISFTILRGKDEYGPFVIDPLLQMHKK